MKRIPTACITVEDAELMWRLAQRGQRIVVKLTMEARTLPDVDSFNTVAEIKGWQHPEQVNPLLSRIHNGLVCLSTYVIVSVFMTQSDQNMWASKKKTLWERCSVQQKHALLLSPSLSLLICQTFSLFWFGRAGGNNGVVSFLLTPDIPTAV